VTTTGALVSVRSSNPRVIVSGGTAETSGYGAASARVIVRVKAGASSITLR
jgi:hypothetical protein